MERICALCHAMLGQGIEADWCPACGGALVSKPELLPGMHQSKPEVDHRGIVLPRRHAVGGIITPQ